MANPFLKGKVLNGKVMLQDAKLYSLLVQELEGRDIMLQIDRYSPDKSSEQLNTYWGIIIGKYMMQSPDFEGWTKTEIDDYLGDKFRYEYRKIRKYGQPEKEIVKQIIPLSSKKFRMKDMALFIEQVIQYLATEHQIFVEIESS